MLRFAWELMWPETKFITLHSLKSSIDSCQTMPLVITIKFQLSFLDGHTIQDMIILPELAASSHWKRKTSAIITILPEVCEYKVMQSDSGPRNLELIAQLKQKNKCSICWTLDWFSVYYLNRNYKKVYCSSLKRITYWIKIVS